MIFGEDFFIRQLAPSDNTNGFKTGDAVFQPLKTFFVSQAQEFHQHGVAKTYAAVGKKDVQVDKICQSARKFDHPTASNFDQGFKLISCAV